MKNITKSKGRTEHILKDLHSDIVKIKDSDISWIYDFLGWV